MKAKILIVEDEEAIAQILSDYLRFEGYEAHILTNGLKIIDWVHEHNPSLILLDLMLPGKGGLEICREVRALFSVPIIMTTARVEEIDRLLGLEMGADDYVCKPYSPREVVARVKAVLRRGNDQSALKLSGLFIDESSFCATMNGHNLQLTAVEFRLLSFMVAHPGRVFNRQQLLDNIYPDERVLNDRAIDNFIKNIRKKLSSMNNGVELIHSVYGVGYKFDVKM